MKARTKKIVVVSSLILVVGVSGFLIYNKFIKKKDFDDLSEEEKEVIITAETEKAKETIEETIEDKIEEFKSRPSRCRESGGIWSTWTQKCKTK